MKYIDEFRDGDGARHIAANIAAEVRPDVAYNFMEFCGGHTHAISRYGIADMLPANVRMTRLARAARPHARGAGHHTQRDHLAITGWHGD